MGVGASRIALAVDGGLDLVGVMGLCGAGSGWLATMSDAGGWLALTECWRCATGYEFPGSADRATRMRG